MIKTSTYDASQLLGNVNVKCECYLNLVCTKCSDYTRLVLGMSGESGPISLALTVKSLTWD